MPNDLIRFGLVCFVLASLAAATEPRRPNLILIVSDDQGFDLGAYGSKQFVTPHLDRMATEGVRATQFYVTASVCTPSRSGLITGRYPQRNGLYDMVRNDMVNYGHRYTRSEYAMSSEMTLGLDPREITIGNVLQRAADHAKVRTYHETGRLIRHHVLAEPGSGGLRRQNHSPARRRFAARPQRVAALRDILPRIPNLGHVAQIDLGALSPVEPHCRHQAAPRARDRRKSPRVGRGAT